MDRREFIVSVAGGLLVAPLAAEAQALQRIYRVGFVARPEAADAPPGRSFRDGLRELGWVEGQTVTIDWRWTGNEPHQLDAVVAAFVRTGVDVIVTGSTPATLAAKRATQTVPIVIAGMAYPVERGVVASLARPGGNVTGVAGALENFSKQLQLLKETAPGVSRVAYLQDPLSDLPAENRTVRRQAAAAAARKLGLDVRWIDLRSPTEIDAALSRLASSGANGFFVSDTASLFARRDDICAFAAARRLPAIGRARQVAEAGCLMSYGPDLAGMWGRAAAYVDRILRGANPADLPVEQPTKLELVINRKTAKALGLTIPPSLLQRADQVIE